MKRTKREAQQTKEKILETAFKEFLKNGFEETTIDNIAKVSGNTRGAVYWHFKDKHDIFDQLVEQKDIEAIAVCSRIINSSMPPLSKLKEIINLNFPDFKKKNEIKNYIKLKLDLYIYRAKNGDKRNISRQIFDNNLNMLKVAQMQGHLKKEVDPVIAAKILISLVQGIFISQNILGEKLTDLSELKKPVMNYFQSLINPKYKNEF